jgi:hypothetical protein
LRIFKTRNFARFQRKERIDDATLRKAISAAEQGLVDADLGRGLIKQRVARPGEGKRGGYRTIIAWRAADRCVFLYGFAKNQQANISKEDERDLRDFGNMILALDGSGIEIMMKGKELVEVKHGKDNEVS